MLKFFERHFVLDKVSFFSLFIGCSLMAFAMVNIHMQAKITEGGMLGLSLLLAHFSGLEPSYWGLITDSTIYLLAFSLLGKMFIKKALFSAALYALMLKIFMAIGPVLPSLAAYPALAAVIGGLSIGVGCSFVVLLGFATSGDDAFVLLLFNKLKVPMGMTYMALDLIVLGLSISYLPLANVAWSLMTTMISSAVVGKFETSALANYLHRHLPTKSGDKLLLKPETVRR